MKITQEQCEFLNSFSCERLSKNAENASLITKFENKKAALSVAEHFKKCAWSDDKEGNVTYYIIKNSQKRLILFFALRCGSLFTSIDEILSYCSREKYDQLERQLGTDKLRQIQSVVKQLKNNLKQTKKKTAITISKGYIRHIQE